MTFSQEKNNIKTFKTSFKKVMLKIANLFNKFFINMGPSIKENIRQTKTKDYTHYLKKNEKNVCFMK